jgi:hypothetical protein
MNREIMVSSEEELKLRKSFEFGAYLLTTHHLAKNYGIDGLERFARFWAETAALPDRKSLVAKSKQEFLEFEAKIEKVWVGRKAEKSDVDGYVGVVEKCPIRSMSNIIYPYAYKLLRFKSSIEKLDEGCRLVIQC